MSYSVDKLFVKYGSLISSGVAEILYDKILDDNELSEFFSGVDMDGLAEHMADLLSMVTGGPDIYRGLDIEVAHTGLNITIDAFERMIQFATEAMQELEIDDNDAQLVIDVINAYQGEVVSA